MTERQKPQSMPEVLKLVPFEGTPSAERKAGRPPKPKMPPLPALKMGELEQQWYVFFVQAYQHEYPDLTNTDLILLQLAAVEYIKYQRVLAFELETGQTLTMARQHPGTNMRALLDQLSVTRRARQNSKPSGDDEKTDRLMKLLNG